MGQIWFKYRLSGRVLLGCAVLAGGCASEPGTAGRSAVSTSYSLGSLTAEVGPDVSVVAIATAGEQALRARGYAVESREVTEDRAVVVGRAPGAWRFTRTVVESRVTRGGTAVSVKVEPLGDEGASYAVMDDLLGRLGR